MNAPKVKQPIADHRVLLATCVAAAMTAGRTEEIVDELLDALRFDRITTGPERQPAAADAGSNGP